MVDRYSSEVIAVVKALEWDAVPTASTLRVALFGGMYDDPDNPGGLKVHYQGCIKSDVIFKKQIGIEFWQEDSNIDFGYLDLALENQRSDFIDFGKNVVVASIEVYRVNLSSPTEDELELIASARSSDIGFADEFTLRIRMESILQDGFDSQINKEFYGYERPHLTGKPQPIAWGLISDPQQVLPTVTVDNTILLYHVTDLDIASFESGVYDRGVLLVAPTSFEPSGDYRGFTLNQNPDGRITCGRILLIDPHDPPNYMHGLFRFVRLVMNRTGLWSYVNQAELTQLETDIGFGDLYPQFFSLNKVVSLEQFLKKIFEGVTGWYYVDELSEIHVGRMVDPDAESTPLFNFTDATTKGRIRVEDDRAPGLSTRLSYAYNPGAYDPDEIAGSVYGDDYDDLTNRDRIVRALEYYRVALWSADDASWTADDTVHTADGYAGMELVSYVRSYWRKAEVRDPIELLLAWDWGSPSAFDLAQGEVNRWWSELYYKRRRFYTFDVELNSELFDTVMPQLGQFCTLQSDRFKLLTVPKNLFIRRLAFNYSKNLITVEGWG